VAVGSSPTGALVTFSSDGGQTWQVGSLQAGTGVEARSVVATPDGFVTVGATGGQWDPQLLQVLGGSRAVWTSSDGLAWQAANIKPATNADRLTFTAVYAAADGLLAVASDTSGSVPGFTPQYWASTDGRTWDPLGVRGTVVPCGQVYADGVRMLILDAACTVDLSDETPWPGYLSGSTSLDGRTWTPVSFSGQLMDQQSADGAWLTSQGLIYSGTDRVWLAAGVSSINGKRRARARYSSGVSSTRTLK
jgi:hypothetical protein